MANTQKEQLELFTQRVKDEAPAVVRQVAVIVPARPLPTRYDVARWVARGMTDDDAYDDWRERTR